MQEIGKIAKEHTYTNKKDEKVEMNINCIPNNMEKYMAFMLGNHLVFLDSFKFMSSSLDNLVKSYLMKLSNTHTIDLNKNNSIS